MNMMDAGTLLAIVGGLVAVTNIITEVLQKLTWDKLPTNILVVIISEALTLASGMAFAQIKGLSVLWYHVVAGVVVGFFVAYAAMFGYDKLKEVLNWSGKHE